MCVTRNKKSDGSGSMGGDRALVSLINNTLETYHINSPDSVFPPAVIASSSSSSQKKAKRSKASKSAGEAAEGDDEEAGEEEEEEEGEEESADAVTAELIQNSSGELVLKQAVLDLHGHRYSIDVSMYMISLCVSTLCCLHHPDLLAPASVPALLSPPNQSSPLLYSTLLTSPLNG